MRHIKQDICRFYAARIAPAPPPESAYSGSAFASRAAAHQPPEPSLIRRKRPGALYFNYDHGRVSVQVITNKSWMVIVAFRANDRECIWFMGLQVGNGLVAFGGHQKLIIFRCVVSKLNGCKRYCSINNYSVIWQKYE